MATFTEDHVEVSFAIYRSPDPTRPGDRCVLQATSFLANGTQVRTKSFDVTDLLSAARKQGIADLFTDGIAYAKSQFGIS